jgi:H+/Cl- antiporter ClcA
VLIVLAAVPIAIITNAARVSGTGILARYYGTEVADGFFHEFSGWVIYVVAFLLLFAFGWLLDRFNPSRGGRGGGGAKAAAETGTVKAEPLTVEGKGATAPAGAAMSVGGNEGAAG